MFVIKAASAIMAFIMGLSFQLTHFVPGGDLNPQASLAIRVLACLVPLTTFLLGAYLLRSFPLDEVEHRRIRQALEERDRLKNPGTERR